MPEGDTVHLSATRLHKALAGVMLTRTDFRVPQLANANFSGRRVQEVVARGKHLLMRIEGGATLHTHFKMEGSWHLYRPEQRWRGPGFKVRVVLESEPWIAVGFELGLVELLETVQECRVLGHLGPDVLGDDWDANEAARRLSMHPDAAIVDALQDQTIMAGPGNVYANEICFLSGLYPWTRVADVPDPAAVVALTKRVMEANRATARQITTGDMRRGHTHWVYGRRAQPCMRCGSPIDRRAQQPGGSRVTYWCPTCQV